MAAFLAKKQGKLICKAIGTFRETCKILHETSMQQIKL